MRRLLLFLALALLVCAPAGAAESGLPKGLAWIRELGEDPISPPVLTGDVVLIRTPSHLYAFRAEDGTELWSTESTGADELRADRGVVLDSGTAREAATGWRLWESNPEPGSITLDGGRAWWLDEDVLVSCDLRTGEVRFRRQFAGIREFHLQGGYALFVDAEGAGAWNLQSDRLAWRQAGAGTVLPTSGGALVLGREGRLQKVLPSGRVAWQVAGPVAEVRALEQGLAALRTKRHRLQVLDADGRDLWSRDSFYDLDRLVDLGAGRLLLSDYDGTSLLDARTGRILGAVRDGQLWPAGRLGEVVAGVGRSGANYRLDARSGRLLPGFRGQLPQGWGGGSAAMGSGRVFLARGGSLVAVGPGPGLRHVASAPELVLTVPSPQLPGSAGVTLHGRFTRLVALQAWRMPGETPKGPPVLSRTVSLPAGHESQELSVRLPLPGPGTYLVTARAGGASQQAVLTATGLGLTAKLAPERLLVQAVDTRTGRPAAGVDVALFRQGKRLGRTRTDASGAALLPVSRREGEELVVMAAWKGQRLRFPFTPEQADWSHAVFLETDRPIYRPGHKVHFRGVAMRDRAGELQVAPGEKVAVEVRDAADNRLLAREVTTDEAGVFAGDLVLAAEPPLGRYSLSATVAGSTRSSRLPFDVQEYRKPPFQVEVRPQQPLVVGAQPLTFLVAATRWFGGPVPGASLRWRLERQRLYGGPSEPDEEESWRGYREFVSEGTAVLDELGRATLRLEVPPPEEHDFSYVLQVDVAGEEGREVPGSATVLASRGEFTVTVSPRSWLARPGQPLALDVSTRDLLGRGHAAEVRLAFHEERWAGGEWDLVRRGTVTLRTGAEGRGSISWSPPTAGYYRVEATARDRAGRVLTDHTWVWVPGEGSLAYDWPSLKLIPERRTARPGERIRVLVLADRPGALLWTVEGTRLFDHRVVAMRGPATVVEVPIRPEHAPEIHLSATLMRQDEPATAQTRIRVPDTAHEVKVELAPDREDYRPGGTARLDLRTSRGGKPVQAHLSLALVDEAIFALREDQAGSIHRFFYGGRENRVETFHLVPRSAQAAGFQTVEGPARVRSEFQDTAFWSARVVTGPDGTGRVEVPLPDDLTRWRATARAVAPPDGVGQAVSHLVTRLPLMVQVIAPRFFVAGDRSAVLAVVHNRTAAPVEAGVTMQAQGAVLAPGTGRVSAPVGGSGRDAARVEVAEGPEVVLQAEARAAGEADAERIRVPVEPRGVRRSEYRGGVAHGPLAWDLEVPPGATRGSLEVRVDGSAAGVVSGALGYLVGFPYGCVEQTMSRFLPTVIASQAMEKLGLATAVRRAELEPMVNAGLQKLYGYQHSDGGWGWWASDRTHPYMTGYVVMGLARAREAGWEVSEPVLARGIQAATALMAASREAEERAWLAWSLAEAGQPPREVLAALASGEGLGAYSRALVTLALVRAGDLEAARRLAERLKGEAVTEGSWAWWPARSPTPYGWTDDDVEATSLVIRALQEALGPDEPLVARGVDWLIQQRRGSAWKSTRDTAQAVMTLSRFLEARGATGAAGPAEVLWKGQVLGVVDPARPEPRPIQLEGLPPGRHRVEVRPSGGAPVASARLSWVEPLRAEGESHGVTVTRRLLKVDGTALSPLEVRAGDLLQVQLLVDAPRALEYVLLEDPRAAGVEPVPEEREAETWQRYTRREDRDERTVFFFTDLEKGQTTVSYSVRAETPGTFTVLPARVELMYRPEVWGLSEPAALEIR